MRTFHTYIITNKPRGTLYVGITSNIEKRIFEHKNKTFPGFSKKYNLDKLVYAEEYYSADDAIYREKQMKGLSREKKIALIEGMNPQWKDLMGF